MFTESLRFLVIEGYNRAERAALAESGMTIASDLYKNLLLSLAPNAQIDIATPADDDTPVPDAAELASYDGVTMTGSSLSVLEPDKPAVRTQIDLIDRVFDAGTPMMGSCWAMQVGAIAAGGVARQNPKGREMGFARKVALTESGKSHPMFEGKSAVFDSFASHEDEISIAPPNSTVLAENAYSDIQALEIRYRNGVMWAVQYHPEYNLHEMAALIRCRAKRLIGMGFFDSEQSAKAYADTLDAVHEDAERKDLKWALGIDADIMDTARRYTEARNWIKHLALPAFRSRA